MTKAADPTTPCMGFLTVVEHEELGVTGGYLVLNKMGRPLEFHCTAPVKVTRTQEILYGPTLKPCLYGEQIGWALVEKSREKPACILTDVTPMLALRHLIDCPVALVLSQDGFAADEAARRHCHCADAPGEEDQLAVGSGAELMPKANPGWLDLQPCALGGYPVAVLSCWAADMERLQEAWNRDTWMVDLREPFGRIREAIGEAHKAASTTATSKH